MTIPNLSAVKALDGRIFAMLSPDEVQTLDFFRTQGRKFDVSIDISSQCDPAGATVRQDEFDAMTPEQRLALVRECMGEQAN